LKVSDTKAATSLSGLCGMVVNIPRTFTIFGPNTPLTIDAMAVINFDTQKIWVNTTTAIADSSYSPTAPSRVTYASEQRGPFDFKLDTGPVPGSYTLTFIQPDTALPFNLLPVNSGNTILVQGQNNKLTGVCQNWHSPNSLDTFHSAV